MLSAIKIWPETQTDPWTNNFVPSRLKIYFYYNRIAFIKLFEHILINITRKLHLHIHLFDCFVCSIWCPLMFLQATVLHFSNDSRKFFIYIPQMISIATLEAYGTKSNASPFDFSLRILTKSFACVLKIGIKWFKIWKWNAGVSSFLRLRHFVPELQISNYKLALCIVLQ